MTDYIILILCIIVVVSYVFDITARYSKIPGVIFLIILGIGIKVIVKSLGWEIPDLRPLLPVMGTLGLVMIVMDASLDLKLVKEKKRLIIKSIISALILFIVLSAAFLFILTEIFGVSVRDASLNAIPLGVISSSVAIPSAMHLKPEDREFVVYESSFSDIFGILLFDFILISEGPVGQRILSIGLNGIITVVISVITAMILGILLHKINYHINYVIIMTSVVLVYILAKISHLPALLLVLTFGLVLSNSRLLEFEPVKRFIDFPKFRTDVEAFKKILTELTFLVRSLFFILFGYYTTIEGILNWRNVGIATAITSIIFLLRMIFMKQVLRMKLVPLLFFTPRGLITVLLFLSIPAASRIPLITEEVITLVILFTIFVLVAGNFIYKDEKVPLFTPVVEKKNEVTS
jgi:Kef-type K+ transport system membrane component KefB